MEKNTIDYQAQEVIKDPQITGKFIEMGSGPVVVNALCAQPGSSGTVQSALYPNSKVAQQAIGVPEGVRSVSFEAAKLMLDQQPHDHPTVMVSSWQIPSQTRLRRMVGLGSGSK